MIADEHEYQVTMDAVQRLAAALAEADGEAPEQDPRHQQLMRAAIASQMHDLQADLAAYEARTLLQRAPRAD